MTAGNTGGKIVPKKILKATTAIAFVWICALPAAFAQGAEEAAADIQPADSGSVAGVAASTVIYNQDFFDQFPNAVSVIDIIRRIPGGQQILNSGGGQRRRGFSSNDDRILINGRRLSGKQNDSTSALERITLASVERELIRGGSPDVKVSSQEAILNIVLDGEAQDRGGGSWRAESRTANSGHTQFGGFLSYGDKLGNLEYFASARYSPRPMSISQDEFSFDEQDRLTGRLIERITNSRKPLTLSSNFTYSFANGDAIRFNGQYSDIDFKATARGQLFDPDGVGGFIPVGASERFVGGLNQSWEIGGDYETGLGDKLKLKIIGLYRQEDATFTQREDFEILNDTVDDDVISIFSSLATEKIGRVSVSWDINSAHDLEIGSELAINDLDVDLEFSERDDMGVLVPVDVSAADVLIKETRSETFATHTWTLNPKMSLETSIFIEYSKLEQVGADIDLSRNFFFLRPTTDFRYNITSSDQLQLSVRRTVSQLNFSDFASSVSGDDQVQEGNRDLSPEKAWQFEGSFEHRFANDGGNIKLTLVHFQFEDKNRPHPHQRSHR